jgi:hypothetical protein
MSMSRTVGLYSDKNFCSGCKPHIRIVIVGLYVHVAGVELLMRTACYMCVLSLRDSAQFLAGCEIPLEN